VGCRNEEKMDKDRFRRESRHVEETYQEVLSRITKQYAPERKTSEKSDKFVDACGVFGIYRQDYTNAAPYVYYGLYALQHRGQECAELL
jgi:hypothetical protein